jgi:hypothetical protein
LAESSRKDVDQNTRKDNHNRHPRGIDEIPEGDGGLHLDYQWVQPEQSSHVAKAILLEWAANGLEIVKKGA